MERFSREFNLFEVTVELTLIGGYWAISSVNHTSRPDTEKKQYYS